MCYSTWACNTNLVFTQIKPYTKVNHNIIFINDELGCYFSIEESLLDGGTYLRINIRDCTPTPPGIRGCCTSNTDQILYSSMPFIKDKKNTETSVDFV